jgi:regulator of RNase E activity RraA
VAIGFRVLPRQRKVAAEVVQQFRDLPVASVSDVMARITAAGPRLRPLHAGGVLAGPALTVKSRPGGNLMVHKALQMAEPGDVIVVDAGGDFSNAIIGELMLAQAARIGVAGVVINGAVRDYGAIRASRFPVFAAGVIHRGPYKDGPGEVNVPIAIDGMIVEPGDLILGDDDGLVCVAYADTTTVHAAAVAKQEAEAKIMAATAEGSVSRPWVDETLKRLGCEGV